MDASTLVIIALALLLSGLAAQLFARE